MLLAVEKNVYYIGYNFSRRFFSEIVKQQIHKNYSHDVKGNCDLERVQENTKKKTLFFAILGAPNVGKSTLINQLSNRTICPASCKPHTTESKSNVIYTEDDTQLVLIDTPGFVTEKEAKRYSLKESFKTDPKDAVEEADVVAVMQDASNIYTRHKIDNNIVILLNHLPRQVQKILILNKVDKLKQKRILLELTNNLTKDSNLPSFQEVFMISALDNDGVDDLRRYLLDSAKEQNWRYNEDTFSDQSPMNIVEKTVRAKLLDNLRQEIPYKVLVTVEHYDVRVDGTINAVVNVVCPNTRCQYIIVGSKGSRVHQIAKLAEDDLRNAFRTSVSLKIAVKCKEKE